MSTDSEAMGRVIYQAAIEVAQGRKISVRSALVAACKRLMAEDPHQDVYGILMWKECMRMINHIGNTEAFPVAGGFRNGGFWLTKETKSWVVIFLLFCYEYCVTEISGGQGRILENVTPRNEECDGSQTDRCRFETSRCDECPLKGRPNCP